MSKGRKCPKCGSRNFSVIEIWRGMTIEFMRGQEEGILSSDGEPYKLEGCCFNCGYLWTLRGFFQMYGDAREVIFGTGEGKQ